MRINPAGLGLLKRAEGLRLDAYRCKAGKWTIGWGHTGPEVFEGLVIHVADAEALLRADVAKFEHGIESLGLELNENQFSALVSLAFNVGLGALVGIKHVKPESHLIQAIRAKQYLRAADGFLLFDMILGKHDAGLHSRRELERELFLRRPDDVSDAEWSPA